MAELPVLETQVAPDVCNGSLAQHTPDETRPGRRTRPAPAHTPSRLAQGSDSTTEVLGRVPESTGESILDGTGNSSALPPSSIPLLPSDTLPGPLDVRVDVWMASTGGLTSPQAHQIGSHEQPRAVWGGTKGAWGHDSPTTGRHQRGACKP